jgi:hypothetical protein
MGRDQLVTRSHRQGPPPLVHPRGPSLDPAGLGQGGIDHIECYDLGQRTQMARHEPTRGDGDGDGDLRNVSLGGAR